MRSRPATGHQPKQSRTPAQNSAVNAVVVDDASVYLEHQDPGRVPPKDPASNQPHQQPRASYQRQQRPPEKTVAGGSTGSFDGRETRRHTEM